MAEEPHYRDSVKKLDLKISEIAESEDKPKLVVRSNILCDLLGIQKGKDGITSYLIIRETLASKCLEKNIPPTYMEHQLLCEYFGIPIYHRPKINILTKFRVLKILIDSNPQALTIREIAERLKIPTHRISKILKYYEDSLFERVAEKDGLCKSKWRVSFDGIDSYYNGDAKTLKRTTLIKKRIVTNKCSRRKNPVLFKILAIFHENPYVPAHTSRSIADILGMNLPKIDSALRLDNSSNKPYFKRIKNNKSSPARWTPTGEGYKAYLEWKRKEA